jgi:hypothetical protein
METYKNEKTHTLPWKARSPFASSLARAAYIGVIFWAVLLASCAFPELLNSGQPLTGGAIAFQVNGSAARTLVPNIDMNIATYTYAGTGPGGATFSAAATATAYTASNLVQGSWSVTVNALNAAGTVIDTGTASVSVVTGQTAALNIIVAPIVGNGTLSVTLTWPAALVSVPQITASLTSPAGKVTPLAFSAPANGTSTYTGTVANGYYTLSIQLLDSGQLVMGSVEIARIVTGQTTTGAYNYTSINVGKGSIIVNITPVITNPIPVTVTGAVATVATGTPVNLSASVPAGNTVTYVWYVNGASVGTGATFALNTAASPLSAGSYRVDCVAFSANGQNGGDSTFFMNVTPATSVTLAWDASSSTGVTGYKVYLSTSSGTYGTGIAVGNVFTYTVTGLAKGVTYYFVTTASNATTESGYSNELSWSSS